MCNPKTYFAKFLIFVLSYLQFSVSAQQIIRTDDELINLLSDDKEQGTILLDGDLFNIAGMDVKAGGLIKPFPGRKPVLIGFHQKVTRGNRSVDKSGYWTVPIKSYGYSQIVFLDNDLEAVPYSCHINGTNGYEIKEKQIKIIDKEQRLVAIPIIEVFDYLKNRDKAFFKNFSIKISYWFVGMTLRQIYSDSKYIYGIIDNTYNFNLLSKRPYARVRLEFFNVPKTGDGIYIDGNDLLHVPSQYDVVRVCTTPPIMNLVGNRDIVFEGITFTGANTDAISIQGSNKHFRNCIIRNCGSGIVASNGRYTNCSVVNCIVENLYNNIAVKFSNIDDAVIEGNTIRHTGKLMKGGSVLSVGGYNFSVKNNNISDYSYIAISAGVTREYNPGTVSGTICGNLVDNVANYGNAENQLTDGGGIYIFAHTDGVVIENNIVRNIGYEGCELWGIYLDDGAYNCTIRCNLVYNLWPGQYAITARYVKECERSCMNNVIEKNIFIGPCLLAGNRQGFGDKTIISNNYIAGKLKTQGDEYVYLKDNNFVSAKVRKDGIIVFGNGDMINMRWFTSTIKQLIKINLIL